MKKAHAHLWKTPASLAARSTQPISGTPASSLMFFSGIPLLPPRASTRAARWGRGAPAPASMSVRPPAGWPERFPPNPYPSLPAAATSPALPLRRTCMPGSVVPGRGGLGWAAPACWKSWAGVKRSFWGEERRFLGGGMGVWR